jgi:hypothetical protein
MQDFFEEAFIWKSKTPAMFMRERTFDFPGASEDITQWLQTDTPHGFSRGEYQ